MEMFSVSEQFEQTYGLQQLALPAQRKDQCLPNVQQLEYFNSMAMMHFDPFSVQSELLYKHPLENIWTLWHWENDRSKSWTDMLNEVTSFNTVEDFWSIYYFIKPPSEIKPYNDYLLFKRGIRPMWEDDCNKHGGRWVVLLNKHSKAFLDKVWHDLILSMIGECYDYSDHICGAVVNIRQKANKISLWTKDANDEKAVLEIGNKMKHLLPLNGLTIQYQVHKDAMVQLGPEVHAIYVL